PDTPRLPNRRRPARATRPRRNAGRIRSTKGNTERGTTMLRAAAAVLLTLLIGYPADAGAAEFRLAGRWVLNRDLTLEEQPDGPEQRALLDKLPSASVSVGGVPLPRTGEAPLPRAIGSPRNPAVLETTELSIE